MLKRRGVFVTGGGSGIGLAIAKSFAEAGASVTIGGRDQAKLKRAGIPCVEVDATDEDSLTRALNRCGQIDIFIANAGAAETAPALKTDRALWDRMIAVNLTSAFLCARAAVPQMAARGWGRFIAIGSTASLKGYPYAGAYAAAKHGLLGWIKTLALELATTGVTANAICPGYTATPMLDAAARKIAAKTGRGEAVARERFTKNNPMGRLIDPAEIASLALWLASEAASSVNGQAIVVDGGESAG